MRRVGKRICCLMLAVLLTLTSGILDGVEIQAGQSSEVTGEQTMNTDFAVDGFRRIIDDEHPALMFTIIMGHNTENDSDFIRDINYRCQDIKLLWETIPEDIRPYCVLTLHFGSVYNKWNTTADARQWVEDNLKQGKELGIPMMLIYGGGRSQAMANGTDDAMTWIQTLYDNYSNFIGTTSSEQTDADVTAAVPQLVQLAAQNGGYHIHANQETINQFYGKIVKNQSSGDILRANSEHFIYTPKNVHCNYDYNFSEAYGMYLAGMSCGFGTYVDAYNWYQSSTTGGEVSYGTTYSDYSTRAFPESAYATNMIENALNGATVFQYENQMDVPAMNSLYSPLFWNAMIPAMRTIINTIDIPNKEECIAKTKVGYYEDATQTGILADCGGRGTYAGSGMLNVGQDGESTTFFEGLYDGGIDMYNTGNRNLRYFFRSSGRYGIIPQIPVYTPQATLDALTSAGMTIIDYEYYSTNFKSVQDKIDFFNQYYPQFYTGDATVNRDQNSYQIYNNCVNEDRVQSAYVTMDEADSSYTGIDFLDLTTHSEATVTNQGQELVIDLNNYRTDRGAEGDLVANDGGKRVLDVLDYYNAFKYCLDPSDEELRETKFIVHTNLTEKPELTIAGYDRNNYSYTQSWDAASGNLTVSVLHNGPVSILLNPTEARWSSQMLNQSEQNGQKTAVFFGTSVKLTGSGTTNVQLDGTAWAQGIDLTEGLVITGLTNANHTVTVSSGATVTYIPAEEQMLLDSYLQDFAYASGEDDQNTYGDTIHWTVTGEDTYTANAAASNGYVTYNKTGKTDNGVMKILPYVSPFWSDIPLYMTKQKYTNATYEADFNTSAGTPVSFSFRADITKKSGYYLEINPLGLAPTNAGTGNHTLGLLDGISLKAAADPEIKVNQWYTIKLVVQDSTVTVYLKERGSAEYGDAIFTYSNLTSKEGYFGIRAEQNAGKDMGSAAGTAIAETGGAFNDYIYIDNVSLTADDKEAYTCDFEDSASAADWKGEGAVLFDTRQAETTLTDASKWNSTGGEWSVQTNYDIWANGDNGIYQGTSEDEEVYSYAGGDWSDFLYDSLIRFESSGDASAGIVFRVQDENNMYKLDIQRENAQLTLQFMKKVNGTWSSIGDTAVIAEAQNTWNACNLTVRGAAFYLSVNDKQVLQAYDTTYTSGMTGFSLSHGTTASFDNVWVSVLHTTAQTQTPVTSITLTGADTITSAEGAVYTAEVDAGATKKDITWSTSNTAIAVIHEDGSLTPVADGTVTITATANDGSGVKAAKIVTVSGISEVPIVSLQKIYATTNRAQLPVLPETVSAVYADGTVADAEVVWDEMQTSDFADAIAPMYDWDAGKTTCTGTVAGTTQKAVADITVKPVPVNLANYNIGTAEESIEIAIGETITLPAMTYEKMTYQCGESKTFTDPYSYYWWEKASYKVTAEEYEVGDQFVITGHVGKYDNIITAYYKVIGERSYGALSYSAVPAEGGSVSGPESLAADLTAEVVAEPAEGYTFAYWSVTDNQTQITENVPRSGNTITITGIAESDRSYTAHFVKEKQDDTKRIVSVNGDFSTLYPYAQVQLTVTNGSAEDYTWSVSGDVGALTDAGAVNAVPAASGKATNITEAAVLSLSSDAKGTIVVTAVPKDVTSGAETLVKEIQVSDETSTGEVKVSLTDDADKAITYSPTVSSAAWASWSGGTMYNRYQKTEHKWNTATADETSYARYTFNGTGIEVITESGTGLGGSADIYVDDIYQGNYNVSAKNGTANMFHYVFFSMNDLEAGTHTIDIVPTPAARLYRVALDGFVVTNAPQKILASVPEFEEITDLPCGTAKEAAALGLPETGTITLKDGTEQQADITWKLSEIPEEGENSYQPQKDDVSQTFTVTGQIILPEGVDNRNELSLIVTVQVTVLAREQTAAPVADITTGSYTEAQTITLTADEGAAIYYTLDGTTPTTESRLYQAPIQIEKTTTLTAIAVQAEKRNSEPVTYTYEITEHESVTLESYTCEPVSAVVGEFTAEKLPTAVTAVLSDESSQELTVSWNEEDVAAAVTENAPGEYDIRGTVMVGVLPYDVVCKLSISAINLSGASLTLEATEYEYDATAKEPTVTVVLNGQTLTEADYSVTYENNVNAGEAKAVVTGKGKYEGTVTATFVIKEPEVVKYDMTKARIIALQSSYVSDGTAKEPAIIVVLDGKVVSEEDYTVTYENNVDAGEGKIIVTGKGDYEGTVTTTFVINEPEVEEPGTEEPEIVKYDMTKAKIIVFPTRYVYDGIAKEPAIIVVLDGKVVSEEDYGVTYENNVNAGEGKIIVTGKGDYEGTVTTTFVINEPESQEPGTEEPEVVKYDMTKAKIIVFPTRYVYDGTAKEPAIIVVLDGKVVSEEDYTVTYENNVNAGEGKIIVTGKGNYEGTVTTTFVINEPEVEEPEIVKYDMTKARIIVFPTSYVSDGTAKEPAIIVVLDGKVVSEEDYTVTYENNVNAGEANIIVTGKGDYEGSVITTFVINEPEVEEPEIVKYDMTKAKIIVFPTSYVSDGTAKEPAIIVVLDGKVVSEEDYSVTYENNVNAGEGKIIVTGKGDYEGTATMTFVINEPEVEEPEIVKYDMTKAKIIVFPTSYVSDGTAKEPAIIVVLDGKVVSEEAYTVNYENNVNAGEAKIIVTGKGDYEGTVTTTFVINEPEVEEPGTEEPGTEEPGTEEPGTEEPGTEKPGTEEPGTEEPETEKPGTGEPEIVKTDISNASAEVETSEYEYDGTVKKPPVTVILDGEILQKDSYNVTYANNLNAGVAKAVITGKGNYTGSCQASFVIEKAEKEIVLARDSISKIYGAGTFSLGTKLVGEGALTYSLSNRSVVRISAGKAVIIGCGRVTVTVTSAATSNYMAPEAETITITVTPKKAKLTSLKSSKSAQMTVKWSKDSTATGYAISYATNRQFKTAKTYVVKNAKTTQITLRKLSKNKVYYVKIRSYKTVDGKKIYGAYSTVKKVRIHK